MILLHEVCLCRLIACGLYSHPTLPQLRPQRMIWNNGMRYYFSTSIKEIGSMGVGMYLYFWMVRIVAIMFCICAFLSIPAMVLNYEVRRGQHPAHAHVPQHIVKGTVELGTGGVEVGCPPTFSRGKFCIQRCIDRQRNGGPCIFRDAVSTPGGPSPSNLDISARGGFSCD